MPPVACGVGHPTTYKNDITLIDVRKGQLGWCSCARGVPDRPVRPGPSWSLTGDLAAGADGAAVGQGTCGRAWEVSRPQSAGSTPSSAQAGSAVLSVTTGMWVRPVRFGGWLGCR